MDQTQTTNPDYSLRVRPSWDEYFITICGVVATRSHDYETQVGCVIVNPNKRIVSTGYNGLPAGVKDDFWATHRGQSVQIPGVFPEGEIRYDVDKYDTVTHAEANAIVSAVENLHGCHLYSTLFPCNECAKLIITAGIKKIFYQDIREWKANAVAKTLFEQAGIEIIHVNSKNNL
ncbi:MAG: dCMP deaminase family protein [Patescibacteria group bacterium]|nr:dCMP deaminase family protein [Patescibacteria group bacterium]